MAADARTEMLEGLNLFRALEANHARLLAERLRALGSEPGPACVDDVLASQLTELGAIRGFVAQLDALKAANERDDALLAPCRAALARGFEASKTVDPRTHAFWVRLYSEEKVSGGWYRATYSVRSGRRPGPVPPPVLSPEQVVRRAESARGTADGPAACLAAESA